VGGAATWHNGRLTACRTRPGRRRIGSKRAIWCWLLRAELEVRAGIEPASADLQSDASPLCHRTPDGGFGAEKLQKTAASRPERSYIRVLVVNLDAHGFLCRWFARDLGTSDPAQVRSGRVDDDSWRPTTREARFVTSPGSPVDRWTDMRGQDLDHFGHATRHPPVADRPKRVAMLILTIWSHRGSLLPPNSSAAANEHCWSVYDERSAAWNSCRRDRSLAREVACSGVIRQTRSQGRLR
jgi:hypothetical protein